MNELFIKPLEFEKVAYLRISENPAEWTRDIMENFYNTFPYFINYPVRVEFKQKDEQKGYAVGAIHVEGGTNIQVPIIIQNRELYPFDVCLLNGQVIPLTNYTINTYLSGKTPFLRTAKRETGDITTLLFSSGGLGYMREVPMETYKAASLLDKVLPLTSTEEREKVLSEISDERIAEGFHINKTGSCVVKIASETHNTELVKTAEQAEKLIDRDIWYIYKTGEFAYTGVFGNSKIKGPLVFPDMTEEQVNAFGNELIKCAKIPEKKAKGSAKPVALLPIKNSDHSIVLLDNGDYVQIPNHMYIDAPVKISMEAPGQKPELHKTGVFKLDKEYSQPFTITRMWNQNGVDYIEGQGGLEKQAYAMYDVDQISQSDGYTWLPRETPFIKLGNPCSTVKSTPKNIKHRVIKTANELSIDGKTPVDFHDGIWTLIQEGIQKQDVEKIAKLQDGHSVEIEYDLAEPEYTIQKIAEEYDTTVSEEAKKIAAISKNFIKEASVIPDVPTVDKVLALNFVNKDTIAAFIEAIPVLEQGVAILAELLVKARVGVQLIDEGAIRKVMFGVLEIIEVLRGVKNVKGK